jgi:alpha-glucosidase (family GH31 glycosyl hydrolase)
MTLFIPDRLVILIDFLWDRLYIGMGHPFQKEPIMSRQSFFHGHTFFLIFTILFTSVLYSQENPVIIEKKARFTVIVPECIRMEYSETGQFVDQKTLFAENRDVRSDDFKLRKQRGSTIIETSRMQLVYKPDGKPFSSGNTEIHIFKGDAIVRWVPGLDNRGNLGGTIRTLDNVRGKVALDDGILSTDGWTLLDDSGQPILTEDWVMSRSNPEDIDWYFFGYGTDLKAALKAMTAIGGTIPIPRKYMLGSWYSRYWPYSSADYRQIVKEYKENDFPLDIMVLDMDWHREGWTGWSWNRELLPDAENLLSWLHEQGLKVTLNVHPADGIGPHEDMYAAFMKEMGADTAGSPRLPYDASDKKYLDLLFKHTHEPLEKAGVDFWWLDWQQFDRTIGMEDLRNLPWLNRYYFQYAARGNKRGISFSRWGGWGDHKHPIHFSGDAAAIWPMLEFEIPFTSTAGNCGCFFWSHDIGGHMGGMRPETNTRWVQFGATTAALRLHSTRNPEMDKRPWLVDPVYTNAQRRAFCLRSILFPYIYSSVRQSCEETVPLNRPMYIDYPEEKAAYQNSQQYFFGDAFLVAPVVRVGSGPKKVASQRVWFPEGIWYHWFSNERVIGNGQLATVWSDIDEFPLFARGGIPIPMQPYTDRMATEPLETLVVRIYPGTANQKGEFVLYEDDGISKDYLQGQFSLTRIQYHRKSNRYTVQIDPVNGTYDGQVQSRSYLVEFPCTEKADSAVLNGRSVKTDYDENRRTNTISVPIQSIREPVEIKLIADEIDYQIMQKQAEQRRLVGLMDGIDPNLSYTEILKKAEKSCPVQEYEGLVSFLSGISLYRIESNEVMVVKDLHSRTEKEFEVVIRDHIGMEGRTVSQSKYQIVKGGNERIVVDQPLDEVLGVRSRRKIYASFSMHGKSYTISELMDEKLSNICHWHLVGPFDYDTTVHLSKYRYPPEIEENVNLNGVYQGKSGIDVKWVQARCSEDYVVDVKKHFDVDYALAYGVTFIQSEKEQDILLNFNSDDGIEVWMNGEKVHSHHIFRGITHEPDPVQTILKSGINVLLIKISQGWGGWEYKVHVECPYPIENVKP